MESIINLSEFKSDASRLLREIQGDRNLSY